MPGVVFGEVGDGTPVPAAGGVAVPPGDIEPDELVVPPIEEPVPGAVVWAMLMEGTAKAAAMIRVRITISCILLCRLQRAGSESILFPRT
ncbi:hypothetical protein ACM608_01145 [Sphingomonas sp. ID0503]